MAAAAAWTDVVGQRVSGVVFLYFRARKLLDYAKELLAPPMLVAEGEAQAVRGRIAGAYAYLLSSAGDHYNAGNATLETGVLALRGAATDPTTPLPSVEHIPDAYRNVRLALVLLGEANRRSDDAINSLRRCSGHVVRAYEAVLPVAPGVPDLNLNLALGLRSLDEELEAQRSHATTDLVAALQSSHECIVLASAAYVLTH